MPRPKPQKLKEVAKDNGNLAGDPYLELPEGLAPEPIAQSRLSQVFHQLGTPPESHPPGKFSRTFQVDPTKLGWSQELRDTGIVDSLPDLIHLGSLLKGGDRRG
jgi:hypothetical protein